MIADALRIEGEESTFRGRAIMEFHEAESRLSRESEFWFVATKHDEESVIYNLPGQI